MCSLFSELPVYNIIEDFYADETYFTYAINTLYTRYKYTIELYWIFTILGKGCF